MGTVYPFRSHLPHQSSSNVTGKLVAPIKFLSQPGLFSWIYAPTIVGGFNRQYPVSSTTVVLSRLQNLQLAHDSCSWLMFPSVS